MTRWVNKQDVMLFIHIFTLYITADSSTTQVYVWIQWTIAGGIYAYLDHKPKRRPRHQ
jgi:hypothetical protein